MHTGGITYTEAVREFKKRFCSKCSQSQGKPVQGGQGIGMHRNTLSRTIAELNIDPLQIRAGLKRPPRSERPVSED